jgi:uncharacterized protein
VKIDKDDIARLTEQYGGQWGLNHTRRLLQLISVIGAGQTYDPDIVWLACYLHDWGGYVPWAKEGIDHAARSKQVAETFLGEREYPAGFKSRVLECIEFHHNGNPNRSIESILISDADALDFLGIVGVLRDFAKNPKDMRKAFQTSKKRRKAIPRTLLLQKSREIAAKRIEEMDTLFSTFEDETQGYF